MTLSVIDNLWVDHLDAVENLRQGNWFARIRTGDPLVEYKNEAFKMFEQLISAIDDEIVHRIYKIHIQSPEHTHEHQHVHTQAAGDTTVSPQLQSREVSEGKPTANSPQSTAKTKSSSVIGSPSSVSDKKKLGRNDPCPCGSGLKYKKCGLVNASQHRS